MSSNIEQIKSKVSETKNKIEQSRDLSPEEKMAKAREFENVMSEINKDLELLKASATPQEFKEIEEVELEYKNLQKQLTVFKQELDDFQSSVVESVDSNIDDADIVSSENYKSSRWDRNKKTVLIGAGTLGVGLLIHKWWKKRQTRKEKEKNYNSNVNTNQNNPSGTNININNNQEKKSWWKKAILRSGGLLGGFFIWKKWDNIKDRRNSLFNKDKKKTKEKFEAAIDPLEKNKINQFKKDIQIEIENTKKRKYDFKNQRGDIEFCEIDEPNYKIKSRGKETTIGIDTKNNKYKIADLDVWFDDLKELIRVSNLTNRFMRKYSDKKDFWNAWGLKGKTFIYRKDFIQGNGIYRRGYIKDTFRIVKEKTIKKNCPSWKENQIESFVEYLNKLI